jgi:hypothetical protein
VIISAQASWLLDCCRVRVCPERASAYPAKGAALVRRRSIENRVCPEGASVYLAQAHPRTRDPLPRKPIGPLGRGPEIRS